MIVTATGFEQQHLGPARAQPVGEDAAG